MKIVRYDGLDYGKDDESVADLAEKLDHDFHNLIDNGFSEEDAWKSIARNIVNVE